MILITPKAEYRDYLIRYAESGPPFGALPFSYAEFCAALERWSREYHEAWSNADTDQMTRLESLLCL